ncbi:DMT family transporter [Ammoniphilus sp. 3BR4]
MSHGTFPIYLLLLVSGGIGVGMGHMLYNYAIGKIGAAEASIFINLNPFFTLISSAIFLGESIGLAQVIGFISILFGVLMGSGAIEERYHYFKKGV